MIFFKIIENGILQFGLDEFLGMELLMINFYASFLGKGKILFKNEYLDYWKFLG